jgi:hypothetical protein
MNDGQRLSGVGVYLDRPDETDDTTLEVGINATNFSGYTFDALKAYMLDLAHPIGSYYWSSEATNPNSLFGGIWEQIKDQFILAAGDSYAVGDIGGEAAHMLTESELPKLYGNITMHSSENNAVGSNWWNPTGVFSSSSTHSTYTAPSSGNSNATSISSITFRAGGGQTHNNMPPYLVAYCWRRTA